MTNKTIIVVGAGLSGLSAACYAAMNGYKVQVFEMMRNPGGLVSSWKRKDYVIDGGVHFWTGHRPGALGNDLYQELGISKACRFSDLNLYSRIMDQETGRSIDITNDAQKLLTDLRQMVGPEFKYFEPVIQEARKINSLEMFEAPFEKPIEIMTSMDKIRLAWRTRRFFKFMFGKYRRSAREYMKECADPWSRFVFESIFSPDVGVSFIVWILACVFSKQLGMLDGCSTSVTSAMETRLEELGGEIFHNAKVAKISVSQDRAIGVALENNRQYKADSVISACDAHSTLYDLLGARYTNKSINRRFNQWKPMPPIVLVNIGLERDMSDQPWLRVLRLKNPITVAGNNIATITMRLFNYSNKFAPPGKSVIQVSFESEWDYWKLLRKDQMKYREEKTRITEEVSDRLEEMFPGAYGGIEMTDVVTPITTWRYTRNYKGSYMGWVPTSETMTAKPLRTAPGLDSFYMAGQWSSGGGVTPCLYSGKQAVQLICHKDRKKFVTSIA